MPAHAGRACRASPLARRPARTCAAEPAGLSGPASARTKGCRGWPAQQHKCLPVTCQIRSAGSNPGAPDASQDTAWPAPTTEAGRLRWQAGTAQAEACAPPPGPPAASPAPPAARAPGPPAPPSSARSRSAFRRPSFAPPRPASSICHFAATLSHVLKTRSLVGPSFAACAVPS
jgi:hypothetical protein